MNETIINPSDILDQSFLEKDLQELDHLIKEQAKYFAQTDTNAKPYTSYELLMSIAELVTGIVGVITSLQSRVRQLEKIALTRSIS